MITHHPAPELLLDFATGAQPEALALMVATHVTMCPECAAHVAQLQAVGGLLLEQSDAAAVDDDLLQSVLARLDEPPIPTPVSATRPDAETLAIVPRPLRRYLHRDLHPDLGQSLADLPWRSVGWMFKEFRLPLARRSMMASLMRFRPGRAIPQHTHHGNEYTLVLAGGYQDAGQAFGRGDFAAKDSSETHQPMVDEDGECLCLVVLDAPLKLTGTIGRLINPLLRI
ncbi:MAG: cupin domain-containing protein [Defluviicoccus sp.]|nr:MAG: cupin domain-containing protein [Defluviicoccus sp.]